MKTFKIIKMIDNQAGAATALNTPEQDALSLLKSIALLFYVVRHQLVLIEDKFNKQIPHYKKFSMTNDKPSALPIEEVTQLTVNMRAIKHKVIEFKKTFNENDLPVSLRAMFMEIFDLIIQDVLECKDEIVFLGDIPTRPHKPTDHILKTWESISYLSKVGYSFDAYNSIVPYFHLIDLIDQLEDELLVY